MYGHNHRQRYGESSRSAAVSPVECAVVKAHSDLLATGESVSAWTVSQSALVILNVVSFESLGFHMQNVPSLKRLMLTEAKVNSFIHCFAGVQKITSLHDLEMTICESEGIKSFEELGLGPILKHPLVVHYFSVGLEVTEVCKITTEQIVAYLSKLPRRKGRTYYKITVDEFSDFIAKKRNISREHLCIRIQSLGMHIGHIIRGRQSESTILKKCLNGLDVKSILDDSEDEDGNAAKDDENDKDNDVHESNLFPSQTTKVCLDTEMKQGSEIIFFTKCVTHRTPDKRMDRNKYIPKFRRLDVETGFIDDNAIDGDVETGFIDDNAIDGHTWRFIKIWKDSCEKEDNVVEVFGKMLDFYNGKMKQRTRNRAILAMINSKLHFQLLVVSIASIKLGLWDRVSSTCAADVNTKVEAAGKNTSVANKHDLEGGAGFIDDKGINELSRNFIKICEDLCDKEENVVEVYDKMLDFYHGQMKSKKKINALNLMCGSYPHVGLLNVAISSIKFGLWDRMSSSQANSKEVPLNTCAVDVNTDAEPAEKNTSVANRHVLEGGIGIILEDVLKYVEKYFVSPVYVPDNVTCPRKQMIFIREICKLECYLTQYFSVNDFETLGFGDIFTFLADHISLLPTAWQKIFIITEKPEKPLVKVCMSQHYMLELLSQAANSLGENETLSKLMVSELLRMQFPSAGLTLLEDDATEDLLTTRTKNGDNVNSNIVLFSSPLTDFRAEKYLLDAHVCANDAVTLLLRAPMLVDLISWSCWDYKFAPSLGPLVGWLLSYVTTKELLCLVTKDGKVLRIDQLATVDLFLEAFLHGSSFETALKLVSLISLYGGKRNVPLSLLKCHAKHGFEIMFKTSSQFASRFVLDCLGCLPKEFRSFAGELLVSAFRSVTKDAYMLILSECKSTKDHMMIRELGFSLGIGEWFDNHSLVLSESKESVEIKMSFSDNSHCLLLSESKKSALENEVTQSAELNEPSVLRHKVYGFGDGFVQPILDSEREKNAANIIESIRVQEFGLDSNISTTENSILKKQHARLGRALFCLSQELYSQDSHFLLELVQNADDNSYPNNVEPTLTFILQEKSIVVLNNENGFSAENIRAICDVGNSTKKASSAGYIGKKGIGFKSVFRVTDAPEVHSNGFHIKFDLTEGQIGFVLPTIVPPCDMNYFTNLVSSNTTNQMKTHYNTCLVLPLKSVSKSNPAETSDVTSMFSDLHPSLLLFLHRLQCIKFRNLITDSFIIMRKEIIGNCLTNVSVGNETLTWFVDSRKLQANGLRKDVSFTEISIAMALEVLENGSYNSKLDQQYVFAFLPLRTYGLKFIVQGDFVLPSSREEVDGDSPWNQWLLSEFPNLFVSAELSFCRLPGFNNCLGKAVSVFLSYVPLVGEVHGFFAPLPRMIISKLCTSNCLLLEGENDKWVPPCQVLRNWNEQARTLLPDSLIHKHLGLGYLNKEIYLSDTLARALGIKNYGPKVLVDILLSLCHAKEGLASMGLNWLSSWLNELYLLSHQNPVDFKVDSDVLNILAKTPFIPLLDGGYGSINEGMIWMNVDGSCNSVEASTRLFANLRTVNPALFDGSITGNLTQMLSKVGVQRLSAHLVVKAHVLPAICDKKNIVDKDLMIEYLSFIMVHLQCGCLDCFTEREHIISEVYSKAFILTNHGFVIPSEVAIHFNDDFGNHIDIGRLISGVDVKWYEVDNTYLKYSSMQHWRKFLKEVGVTDFVQTVKVEKTVPISSQFFLTKMMREKVIVPPGSTVIDWESQELVDLLAKVSLCGDHEKCKYLLEVFDELWDDYFSDKVEAFCNIDGEIKSFKSSLVSALGDVKWVVTSLDEVFCYPKDLFYYCEAVCSIFGDNAPYAVPKIQSAKLVSSIGFKITVTLHDALSVLEIWKRSATSFKASVSQMSRFYSFVWTELVSSDQKSMANLSSGSFIFVPPSSVSSSEVVSGVLLSAQEVYWHDNVINTDCEQSRMLSILYPSFHDFFVNECGVKENPPLLDYLAFLRHLSTINTPLEAAKKVFDVFVMWSDGLKAGVLSSEDVKMLKRNLEEKSTEVLPTARDKWVSLHSSFGLVCWCDDEKLADEFEKLNNINFYRLCELTDEERNMLEVKVSFLMKNLGIPALSEVVTREAIYYGPVDNSYKTSLVNWVLPYAQRYISNTYPESYHQLKVAGFEQINRLQIVVVEMLYYKNVIKRPKLVSKKRHDCICLLQEEILYATCNSDSHSIFMELSRFLINGDPELHLANFLHMITTMTESGSTQEQIETFVLNSQKVPKLSDEEPVWSIQSMGVMSLNTVAPASKHDTKRTRKRSSSSKSNKNRPPAPVSISSRVNDSKVQDVIKQVDLNAPASKHDTKRTRLMDQDGSLGHVGTNTVYMAGIDQDGSLGFGQKDQLSHGLINAEQALHTGKQGEELAFNYYKNKGMKVVKWVNEASESGLPYDIEVCDDENRKEYIEVKTTDSERKDWFEISVNEWQFAVKKGESFSIARVVLLGDKQARVTVFKNPARLCRLGQLKLAVLMSEKQKDEFDLC
ncbi:protein NO VEIN-like [Bidens hawaiensis]|uniref:protein NO VEIN-like n=1 Tax=Bidens hawaiensis TaxID=980011 RepID=UPI00404AC620